METWEVAIREAVRDTIARYVHAGDRARIADMAACFAEDGVMQVGSDDPLVGRGAIIEMMETALPSERRPTHAHHHVTSTHFLEVTPREVDASSYFTVMTDCGADHWGHYRDRFTPSDGRWLLASRKIRVAGFAADSYFRPG